MEGFSKKLDFYYIEYLDHAYSTETLTEIKKRPFTLFAIGFILEETNDYYIIASSGGRYRQKKISGVEFRVKSTIKEMKIVHTIQNKWM